MLSRLKGRIKPVIAFLAAGAFILSGFPVYAGDSDQLEVTCSDYDQEVLVGSDSQEYMNSLAVHIKNSGSQPVDLSEYEVTIKETSDTGSLSVDPAVKNHVVEPGEGAAVYLNYAVSDDCTAEKITYKAEISGKDGTNHFESSKEYTLIPFSVQDGVLKYNDASMQSKYRLQFEGDAHAKFAELISGGGGNATEIRHTDGTVEYYLEPGAESSCRYTLDDGYEIGSFALDPEDAGTVDIIPESSAVAVDLKAPAVLKVTSREAVGDQEVSIVSGNGFSISAPATAERIEGFPKLQLSTSVPENAEETKTLVTDWLGKTDKIQVYQLDVNGIDSVENGLQLFQPEVAVTMPIPEGWDPSRTAVVAVGEYGMSYTSVDVSADGKSLSLDTELFGKKASNQFVILERSVPTEVKEWDKVVADYISDMRVVTWGNGKKISDLCFEKTPSADVAAYLTFTVNQLLKYNFDSSYYNMEKNRLEIPYADLKSEAEKRFANVPDMTAVDLGFFTYDPKGEMFVVPGGGMGDAPLVTEVAGVNETGSGIYSIWFKVSNKTIEDNPDMTDPSQYTEYTLTVQDNGEGNWKYLSFVKGFVESEDPTDPEQPSGSGDEGTVLPDDSTDKIVQEIEDSKAGDSVTVNMGTATVVPKKVLETAKGKDVDIVLQMDGYTWTINGKDITASDLKDINLEVKEDVKVIDQNIVDQLADGRPVKQISLVYDGEFGFTAELRIYVGTDYEEQYGNLFWCQNGKYFTYIDSGKIDETGYASFTMNHASDYVIVVDEKPMSGKDIPEALRPTGGSVKTGDAANIWLWSGIAVLALAGVAAAVQIKRKHAR